MPGGISGIISGVYGGGEEIYGRRLKPPKPPNYLEELQRTISGDIGLIPKLSDLATQSTELYKSLMETAQPGTTALQKKGTEQILSLESGQVPADVRRNLAQYAAEAGTTGGTNVLSTNASRSPIENERLLRGLGLTSLDLVSKGLDSAQRWIAQAQSQTFDFSKMFMGPQDAIRQAETNWSQAWLAEQAAAAPDPEARGAFDSEMAMLGMILSAYGGGAGYTGQSKPNYGGGYQGQGFSSRDEAAGMSRLNGSYFGGGQAYQSSGNQVDFASDYGM